MGQQVNPRWVGPACRKPRCLVAFQRRASPPKHLKHQKASAIGGPVRPTRVCGLKGQVHQPGMRCQVTRPRDVVALQGAVLSKIPPYSGWRERVEMWRGDGEFRVRPGHVPATSSTPIPKRKSLAPPPGGTTDAPRENVTANKSGPGSRLAACTAAHSDASSAAKTLEILYKVHGTETTQGAWHLDV